MKLKENFLINTFKKNPSSEEYSELSFSSIEKNIAKLSYEDTIQKDEK